MTLTDEHDGRRGAASRTRAPWRLAACATAALIASGLLSGCVQTTGTLVPPTASATTPAGAVAARRDPLAPGPTPADATTTVATAPAAAPAASHSAGPTVRPVTAAPLPAAPDAPPQTVYLPPKKPDPSRVAAKPAPVKAAPPPAAAAPAPVAAVATEPFPTSGSAPPVAASATGGNLPNIDCPPAQPAGKLLPPEERKRIIAELEALRAKQGGKPPPASPAATKALTKEGATHGAAAIKKIEECSGENAADNPDCAAPSE